jgi:hypothetical protein
VTAARLTLYSGAERLAADRITVTEVIWRQEVAEAEVTRLNGLNRDKGSEYVWQVTRIERKGTLPLNAWTGA